RREEGANEIDGLDAHRFFGFFLDVADAHFRERLERGAEAAPDAPGPVRPSFSLTVVGCEEDDHLVAFPRCKRLQDDRLCALDLHGQLSSAKTCASLSRFMKRRRTRRSPRSLRCAAITTASRCARKRSAR